MKLDRHYSDQVNIKNICGKEKAKEVINLKEDIRTKKCITQINNSDNVCCPHAIVTA